MTNKQIVSLKSILFACVYIICFSLAGNALADAKITVSCSMYGPITTEPGASTPPKGYYCFPFTLTVCEGNPNCCSTVPNSCSKKYKIFKDLPPFHYDNVPKMPDALLAQPVDDTVTISGYSQGDQVNVQLSNCTMPQTGAPGDCSEEDTIANLDVNDKLNIGGGSDMCPATGCNYSEWWTASVKVTD